MEEFAYIWSSMKEIFEWLEDDRINCDPKSYPKSYNSSSFEAKRFIIKDSYSEGIDFKIEWEKIICECKVPSEKSNDENIDVIQKEKKGNDDLKIKVDEAKKKEN
jgi:hypothetical protein